MSNSPSEHSSEPAAVEFKGGSFTLPILKLLESDLDSIGNQIAKKVGEAPDFFRNSPVVIELGELVKHNDNADIALLVSLLRSYGLVPIGIRGGNEAQNEAAQAINLAILADARTENKPRSTPKPVKKPVKNAPSPVSVAESVTKIVTQPVRSGQRVYAQGGDLIVLTQVSHGAEIMADGNIHIYGTLRGRALAGVKGNLQTRIFCKDLQAEVISIAGNYRISENLDESVRGKPVQIYLDDRSLIIDEL